MTIEKHWDRLPIGTVLIGPSGTPRRIICELYRPDGSELVGPREPYYVTRGVVNGGPILNVRLGQLTDPEVYAFSWRIAPESFADAYRRDDLAKAGFFSIDDPAHRERRRVEAEELKRRVDAYAAIGLDRAAVHDSIARRLEGRLTGGVWAKSSADYYKRIYALDNAVLYATGAIDHA